MNRTVLFIFCLLLLRVSINAQSFDFNSSASLTDLGFTLIDRDNATPVPSFSFIDAAWVKTAGYGESSTDSAAASTSWYDDADTADDWLITPSLVLDSFSVLKWKARAVSPVSMFRDGYEVRISNTNDINSFLASAPLFSITAENFAWTERKVSLSGYAGETVYIAFRNNSYDKALLLIDDIGIDTVPQIDAELLSLQVDQKACDDGSFTVSATIKNSGRNTIENFTLSYLSDGNTRDSLVTLQVSPDSLLTVTFPPDTLITGSINIVGAVTLAGDAVSANNQSDTVTIYAIDPINSIDNEVYVNNFDTLANISGWTVQDVNNDGYSWTLSDEHVITGNSFTYSWNPDGTTPANDWLFSPCVELTDPSKTYQLSFYTAVGRAGVINFSERMEIKLATAPNAASVIDTNVVVDTTTFTNSTFIRNVAPINIEAAGTYYIGFHAISEANNFMLSIDNMALTGELPDVSFNVDQIARRGFTFTNTSQNFINEVVWNFGDGTATDTVTSATVTYSYAKDDTFSVCLTASNLVGSKTLCKDIIVPLLPVANFSLETADTTEPLDITFRSTTKNFPDVLAWTFGDGAVDTGATVIHEYGSENIYPICLTASNKTGSDDSCMLITAPLLNFTSVPIDSSFEVSFEGPFSNFPHTLIWNFGDGSTASGNSVMHDFGATGTYNVCLTATNGVDSVVQCHNVAVAYVTGIGNIAQPISFKIYPNPTTGLLMLEMAHSDFSAGGLIRIYDLIGKEVYSIHLEPSGANIKKINLGDLQPGIYFLALTGESSHVFGVKFILSR